MATVTEAGDVLVAASMKDWKGDGLGNASLIDSWDVLIRPLVSFTCLAGM